MLCTGWSALVVTVGIPQKNPFTDLKAGHAYHLVTSLTLGAGGLRYLVCVSVCPAPQVLPLRATERSTEGTYGFGAIWETF